MINLLDDIDEVQTTATESGMNNETEVEVKDNHFVSNASLSVESSDTAEGKAAKDAEWLKNVRFAIEGVTQLLVGMIGLIGKSIKYISHLSFDIRFTCIHLCIYKLGML